MENFFQEVNAKFRRAQTVAAPRLQEVSRTLTDSVREVKDGMNNLMMREAQGLYEEDEGLGQMIASVELMRQTLRALDLDVKQHRKDLIAASRSQHSFGEHSAMGGNRIQAIFEKYISEERIMAHLSFSASEISSSTVLDRFANEFGFPVEQLASAFEAKFSHEIAALRRRYTMEKNEYLKYKRSAESSPDESRKYDQLAMAESLLPKWKATSNELVEICERVMERSVKRLSDILINLALFRHETLKKLFTGAEHSAQTATAFRDEPAYSVDAQPQATSGSNPVADPVSASDDVE